MNRIVKLMNSIQKDYESMESKPLQENVHTLAIFKEFVRKKEKDLAMLLIDDTNQFDVFQTNILKNAIEVYKPQAQLFMVLEEMSELQKEVCKNVRGKNNKAAITEEIADVLIMIKQLQMMVGIDDTDVAAVKYDKLCRLAERLKNNEIKRYS